MESARSSGKRRKASAAHEGGGGRIGFARLASLLSCALLLLSGAAAEPAARVSTAANKPAVFDYCVLTLSWSPTYCAELDPGRADPQCSASGMRRYAFVLHGHWP